MREIKFRAWDKKLKKWIDEEWQNRYGYFLIDLEGNITIIKPNNDIEVDSLEFSDISLKERFKIMQCNGNDIYEGDIVTIDIPNIDKFRAEIIFKNGAFWIDSLMPKLLGDYIKNVRVIGNIYENPGLLEDK